MSISDSTLLVFSLCCATATLAGIWLLRTGRAGRAGKWRAPAWMLCAAGIGGSALLALAEFTGRLGPEHFWFREPSFYVAAIVLAGATAWWLLRPAPAWLRFGLPVAAIALAGLAILSGRLDGRAMPLNVSMPTLGVQAPALTWFDAAGRKQSLEQLRDKVVLINFWATWCTPCRREMPLLSRLQRQHAADGLVVVYISLEEPAVLEPFLAANHFDGEKARLDHAAEFYGAGKFYPLSYLVSKDGRIAERWSGRPREAWLDRRVRELL